MTVNSQQRASKQWKGIAIAHTIVYIKILGKPAVGRVSGVQLVAVTAMAMTPQSSARKKGRGTGKKLTARSVHRPI